MPMFVDDFVAPINQIAITSGYPYSYLDVGFVSKYIYISQLVILIKSQDIRAKNQDKD